MLPPATKGIVDTIQDLTVRWQHVLGMTGVFDLEKMALSEKRNWLQTGLELPLRSSKGVHLRIFAKVQYKRVVPPYLDYIYLDK